MASSTSNRPSVTAREDLAALVAAGPVEFSKLSAEQTSLLADLSDEELDKLEVAFQMLGLKARAMRLEITLESTNEELQSLGTALDESEKRAAMLEKSRDFQARERNRESRHMAQTIEGQQARIHRYESILAGEDLEDLPDVDPLDEEGEDGYGTPLEDEDGRPQEERRSNPRGTMGRGPSDRPSEQDGAGTREPPRDSDRGVPRSSGRHPDEQAFGDHPDPRDAPEEDRSPGEAGGDPFDPNEPAFGGHSAPPPQPPPQPSQAGYWSHHQPGPFPTPAPWPPSGLQGPSRKEVEPAQLKEVDAVSWKLFRRNFEVTGRLNRWGHETAVLKLQWALRDEAASLTEHLDFSQPLRIETALQMVEDLIIHPSASDLAESLFERANRTSEETIQAWHSRIRALHFRAYPKAVDFKPLHKKFINGLGHNTVVQQLYATPGIRGLTYTQLLHRAQDIQASLISAKEASKTRSNVAALGVSEPDRPAGNSPASATGPSAPPRGPCFNCKGFGHLSRDCPKPAAPRKPAAPATSTPARSPAPRDSGRRQSSRRSEGRNRRGGAVQEVLPSGETPQDEHLSGNE